MSFVANFQSSFSDNVYNADQWIKMEAAGAVFMPAAGTRVSTMLFDASEWGSYWTASVNLNPTLGYRDMIWCYTFFENAYPSIHGHQYRHFGNSVRPVQDIK
jgi:hypothetical protein